jgi:hypothetical protein
MKYRRLDENGDMMIGHGGADYLKDSPECVAQAVMTRLRLPRGEWFLDLTEGTPWHGLLGEPEDGRDFIIRRRVLETEGVLEIEEYESVFDGTSRKLTVNMRLNTVYGSASIKADGDLYLK